MMFLGYENNEIKIYDLDHLIQNFSVLLASNINLLDDDYYGFKKYIPLTLDIDPKSLPLSVINHNVPISYPMMAISSSKSLNYKNYTSSNGIVELNTKGFCKVILKSDFIFFDVSVPDSITTLKKMKDHTLKYELWSIKPNQVVDYTLSKIKDPSNLITFNEKQTGVAVSPELMVDRYERILFVHP